MLVRFEVAPRRALHAPPVREAYDRPQGRS